MKIEKFNLQKFKIFFLITLIFLNGLIFFAVFRENRDHFLKVVFLNIGQGDSIFIESPSGNQVLIDGGPNKTVLSALGRVMPFYDRTIDAIIATHPDADHVGGFASVINTYKVSKYFNNGATTSTGVFKQLQDEVIKNSVETDVLRAGEILDFGDGAYLKILWPEGQPKGKDTNDYSIVAELYYGNSTFLLTGDVPTYVENRILAKYGDKIKSDVLKVAHHGSKNSLAQGFLSAVNPEFSVISAGLNNRYGHPHKEIMDFLSRMQTTIFKTYEEGDISFRSDGESVEKI